METLFKIGVIHHHMYMLKAARACFDYTGKKKVFLDYTGKINLLKVIFLYNTINYQMSQVLKKEENE